MQCVGFFTQIFAEAGLFEASEWRGHVSLVVGVDKNCAGVELLTDVQSFADVPRENAWCQAVLCRVGPLQDIVHLAEAGTHRGEEKSFCELFKCGKKGDTIR